MKKIIYLSLLASISMLPSVGKAETSPESVGSKGATSLPAPIIGIVEQATLDKSAALKSIIEQVNKKRAEVQKEMATYEKELKEQDKKLAEEQKTLSEKAFTEKRQAFEKRVHEIQEKIEVRRAQMELGVEDAKKKVYEAFLKVVSELRKEVGANIIMYKETIVSAAPELDLTNTALERLNKELPTVKVEFKSEAEVKKQLQKRPLL